MEIPHGRSKPTAFTASLKCWIVMGQMGSQTVTRLVQLMGYRWLSLTQGVQSTSGAAALPSLEQRIDHTLSSSLCSSSGRSFRSKYLMMLILRKSKALLSICWAESYLSFQSFQFRDVALLIFQYCFCLWRLSWVVWCNGYLSPVHRQFL